MWPILSLLSVASFSFSVGFLAGSYTFRQMSRLLKKSPRLNTLIMNVGSPFWKEG